MKLLLLVLFCSGCFYQAHAQKSLAVDVLVLGHFKRFHIYQNEEMTFKLKGSSHKYRHRIVDMEDSVLYIETGESIRLDRIKSIIIDRSNFLTRMLASGFRAAGIGYIAIDAFNSAINGETPVFKERVLAAGGALFVVGEIIHIANKRRLRPGKHTTLKVIDFGLGPE
jgi:hypothetical protein